MINVRTLLLTGVAITLSACGGGSSDDTTDPTSSAYGAGGLFFGSYLETAGGSDADSAQGGLYLQLPPKDNDFYGRMSFQYADCQSTNALKITGQKAFKSLAGTVSGVLDPEATNNLTTFSVSGDYNSTEKIYTGKYNRLGTTSNQNLQSPNCLNYTLSYKGNWLAWPAGSKSASDFDIQKTSNVVSWTPVRLMAKTVVMFLDPSLITNDSKNAIVLQRTINGLPATTLAPVNSTGKTYRVVVQVFDAQQTLIAYGDQTLTF